MALVGLALLVGYAVGAYRIQLFKYSAMEVYNAAAMTVPSGNCLTYRLSVKLLMQMESGYACSSPKLPLERQSLA